MSSIISLLLSFAVSLCDAVMLSSIPAEEFASRSVPGHWWAQVGDRVFYPPASFLALSQNASDYYYVAGSKSALTPKMNEHLVGSEGRWHIMHLPKGPSMLEVSSWTHTGDRRGSVSALVQLKSGAILTSGFPVYELNTAYKHPLNEEGQRLEKVAISHVSHDTTMDYLKKLVADVPTRSYSDKKDSATVEGFLKQEFSTLGLNTCYHNFNYGSNELTNVIGHIPGTGASDGAAIVGAHYDSRPFQGSAPGAEDNGSGVAAMLAMAKAFKASGAKPKKDVYFVAFAGEEPGLIGSKHFADAVKDGTIPSDCTGSSSFLQQSPSLKGRPQQKKAFKAASYSAIIMDEIGWLSPKPEFKNPTVNLESYDSTRSVMDHMRHSSHDHNAASMSVVHSSNPFGSDHMSFLDLGMPAVLAINGDDEAYPHYHKSSDKIQNEDGSFNVDAGLMSMITKMNLGALMRMAL